RLGDQRHLCTPWGLFAAGGVAHPGAVDAADPGPDHPGGPAAQRRPDRRRAPGPPGGGRARSPGRRPEPAGFVQRVAQAVPDGTFAKVRQGLTYGLTKDFITMTTATSTIEQLANREYQYGFVTDVDADTVPRGLNEDIIRAISAKKKEPPFMLEWRLKAYRHWLTMEEPRWWPNLQIAPINYQDIIYYADPKP